MLKNRKALILLALLGTLSLVAAPASSELTCWACDEHGHCVRIICPS